MRTVSLGVYVCVVKCMYVCILVVVKIRSEALWTHIILHVLSFHGMKFVLIEGFHDFCDFHDSPPILSF